MASIVEAFDSTAKEAFSGIKVLVWAIPVCICYGFFKSGSSFGYILSAILSVLFIGYLTEASNNIITKKDRILPGFNALKYAFLGIVTVATMLPYIAISWLVWYLIDTYLIIPSEVWNLTFRVIGAFLAIAFTLTGHSLYIRRLNPLEAFNMRKYSLGYGDVFMSFSYLIVKLGVWSLFILGFLTYLFSLFIGFDNVIWQYLICAFLVFYSFLGMNYMAQTSEEVYTFVEKEEKEKKEKELVDKIVIENTLK